MFNLCFASVPPGELNDDAIQTILADSQKSRSKVLIYSWSPHMVLSVKGADELRFIMPTLFDKVVYARDPKSNLKIANKIQTEHQWSPETLRKLTSATLIEKGVRIHYPSYIFVKNGVVVSPAIPGYKSVLEIQQLAERYLK